MALSKVEKIDLVFEDKYFFALEKPPCLHSVNLADSSRMDSLASRILKINSSAANISNKPGDAGLVNRLDFETSGIMLAAKSPAIWQKLHEMFKKNLIEKQYCAVVDGKAPFKVDIQNFIGAAGRNSKKVKVFKRKPAEKYRAQNAISEFKLIKYLKEKGMSVCDVTIVTGRRHQIRAHAAFIENPLSGDKLYGSDVDFSTICAFLPERPFFLHAWKYSFTHPVSGKNIEIESKSKDLLRVLSL